MARSHLLRSFLVLLALLCLTATAMHPFLQGKFPRTDDGELHLLRIPALSHAVETGAGIWPRFVPGLAYGYGAPLFNYYPVGSYYMPLVLHELGLSADQAWLIAMAGYLLIAGIGAFLLCQQWSNMIGGFVGAVAYVYSPYMLFDTVTRGTTSELAALALLPYALWAFGRLARNPGRITFLLAVTSYAIFMLMHNIMTVYGSLLLIAFSLYLVAVAKQRVRTFGLLFAAGVIALGLTAFYWLPALAEKDAVRIDGVMQNLSLVDVTTSLRSLPELFAFPHTADPARLNMAVPVVPGWPQLILAVGTVVLARWRRFSVRGLTTLLLVLVCAFLFLNLHVSASLWPHLPLLDYTWFAWRTLGPVSLLLAWLAGLGVGLLVERIGWRLSFLIATGCLLILGVYGMPWLYGPHVQVRADTIRDVHRYEIETQKVGLSSYGEYMPIWAEQYPPPMVFEAGDLASSAIARLQDNLNVEVLTSAWGVTSGQLQVDVLEDTTLVFDWLYVPGWRAKVNSDQWLSVQPTEPHGFVSVTLEPGQWALSVALEATSVQQLGSAISIGALSVLVVALILIQRIFKMDALRSIEHRVDRWLLLSVVFAGCTLLAFKLMYVDRIPNPLRATQYSFTDLAGMGKAVAQFDHGIYLLEASYDQAIASGDIASIALTWTAAEHSPPDEYASVVHLVDSNGIVVSEAGSYMPGGIATTHWHEGYYVVEDLKLQVPSHIAPGDYRLRIGLFNRETTQLLNIRDAVGNPTGVYQDIGVLRVNRPISRGRNRATDEISTGNAISFVDTPFLLESVSSIPQQLEVGRDFVVTLDWRANTSTESDYRFQLVWYGAEGDAIVSRSMPLVTDYETSLWQINDVWRGQHRVYVPGTLVSGNYGLGIRLMHDESEVVEAPLGLDMQVTTPERTYTLPAMPNRMDVGWQNGIRLRGYAWDASVSELTLWWQTDAAIPQSLRLFVHALDGDRIVAQSDGVPVNWTRPTTSWDIGEVITTIHSLSDIGAPVHFRVGWYLQEDGGRLKLVDGSDSLLFIPNSS